MSGTVQDLQLLLDEAGASFRAGRLDDAEARLGDALARAPAIPGAHGLLARIALSRGRPAEAIAHCQKALALDGENPVFHKTLAKAAGEAKATDSALAQYERIAAQHPESFGAAYGHALLLLSAARSGEAITEFERALTLRPDSEDAKLGLLKAFEAGFRFREAAEIGRELVAAGVANPGLYVSQGNCLFWLGDMRGAARMFRKALEIDAADPAALTGIAAALGAVGETARATEFTRQLLARKPVAVNRSPAAEANILVVSSLLKGYFTKPRRGLAVHAPANAISQIPARRLNFHYIFQSCPDFLKAAREAGPFDAVYNNIANAEVVANDGSHGRIESLFGSLGLPVANPPAAVAKTSRQRNSEWIPACADVIFPRTVRYNPQLGSLAATRAEIEANFPYPVLIRGVYGHHDTDIVRAHDLPHLMDAIQAFAAKGREFYAIEYCGEEYAPGLFRKLRAAIVGGRFYPVHVGFSPNWNVHRAPEDIDEIAFMKARPELMAEEQAYLRDPTGYVGARNIANLEAIAREAGMDYLGVDYSLRRDGRIVIFEANAAMNAVHANRAGDFPYLAEYAAHIIDAFEEMLLRKAGKL